MAVVAVVVSSIPWWIKAGFIVGIAWSLARLGRRYGQIHSADFITGLELIDGRWRLETRAGSVHHGHLASGYAHPLIVILNFRLENGRRRSLTLLPDTVAGDELRRLRSWLLTTRGDERQAGPL